MDCRDIAELNNLSEKGDKFNFNKYYRSIPQYQKKLSASTVNYTISTLDMLYDIDPDVFKENIYRDRTILFDTIRMDYFCHLSEKIKKWKEATFNPLSGKELLKMKRESYENFKFKIRYLISKGVNPNHRNNAGKAFFNLESLCFDSENGNLFFTENIADFFKFLKEEIKVDLYVSDLESFVNDISLGSSTFNKPVKDLLKYFEVYTPSSLFLKSFIGVKNHNGFLDNDKKDNLGITVIPDDFKITDNVSMLSYLLKKYKIDLNERQGNSDCVFFSDYIQFKETFDLLVKYGWDYRSEINEKENKGQNIEPFLSMCIAYNEKELLLQNCAVSDKKIMVRRI